MYIFCGTGSFPPLWEDWHDIICIYSVASVLVHLCGKIGMILYVYIMWHRFLSTSVAPVLVQLCGTGSCPPLWEDCVYSVAPVLVHLCGTGSCPPLWQRFLSTSVAPVLVHLCEKIGILLTCGRHLHYHIISLRWGVWPLTNKFKHASRY